MMRVARLVPALLLLLGACGRDEFEVLDPDRFHSVIPEGSSVRTLGVGLGFTEGPVWIDRDGGFLVFSDLWGGRLLKWSDGEGVVLFREAANEPNGNALDRQGRLMTCEHAARRITRTEADGRVVLLADRFEGGRFNSPNDLIVHSDGSVWFTDPTYG
ncbi:MAG: SMP-30/gluconolactonase/LRE family protein, partial [Planctomycetota bacterium]